MKTWKMWKEGKKEGNKKKQSREQKQTIAVEKALRKYRQCSVKLKGKKAKPD